LPVVGAITAYDENFFHEVLLKLYVAEKGPAGKKIGRAKKLREVLMFLGW
jgi:hypothetical protein